MNLPLVHQKNSLSQTSLKTLLDYQHKVLSSTTKHSPINSFNSVHQTTAQISRDVSHLADSARYQKLQRQLKQKKGQAEELFNEFLEQQRSRKKTQQHISSLHKVTTTKVNDETFENVLEILDKYSEINLNTLDLDLHNVSKDRNKTMSSLQNSIQQAIEKGQFELNSFRKQTQKKVIQEVKQVNPAFFSTEPAGRLDAINLRKWLTRFLDDVQHQKDITNKQKLVQGLDVLFICLNELVRQVSYNCMERGQLMMAIFRGYMILFQKSINMSENEKQSQYFQSYKIELENQLSFENKIQEKDEKIKELRNIATQIRQTLEESQIESNQLQAQIKQLSKTIDVDRSIKKSAASLISSLVRENAELRSKINRINIIHPHPDKQQDDEDEQDISLTDVLKEVDQKTYVEVNPDIVVKDVVEEPPVITYSVQIQTEDKQVLEQSIQCDLMLVDPNYDKIMSQAELENCLKEMELKEQVGIFTNQQFGIEGFQQQNQEKQQQQGTNTKQSLLRLLDGLPGNMDQVKQLNKQDMLEIFLGNIKQLRAILDKEEQQQYSDTEQSFIEDQVRESKDGLTQRRESVQQSRDSILQSRDGKESKETARESRDHNIDQFQNIIEVPEHLETSPKDPIKSFKFVEAQKKHESPPKTFVAKFGLTKQEQLQLKTQVSMLIMLYNIQSQRSQNQTKSMNDLAELLNQQFQFTRKLMIQLLKTQKQTHRQIVEQFMFEFEDLRKRMPIELDQEIKESEYIITEADEEEEKEKKRVQQFRKRKNKITKALMFNFQQKQPKQTLVDKLLHPGVVLALKAKEQSYLFKKVVNYWPVKNVLRTITQLYDEKIKSFKDTNSSKDLDMQIFVFNNFLNRYGFKTVAEKKYLQYLLSVIHFSSIFRVNIFGRMICILKDDGLCFSVEEQQFFLQGLEFMNSESQFGVNIVQSDSDQKYHVPYLRALDYMKVFLENKLNDDEMKELRQDLENLKEVDPKNLNKGGIIDVDVFLSKVIQKYRIITTRTKEFVIHAFQAADLDGNQKINHNEFITLMRHIEPERFHFKDAMNLFDEQADIYDGEEKNLSFNRYTSLCVNQQIFTETTLNKFIEISSNHELEEKYTIIVSEWNSYKEEIKKTLKELQPYVTQEIFQEWNKILITLEERIMKKTAEIKPILIAHKILRLELHRLLSAGQQDDDIEEIE